MIIISWSTWTSFSSFWEWDTVRNIVDVLCPLDTHVVEKEKEKVDKYQDVKWEFKKIWSWSEVMVIPMAFRSFGYNLWEFQPLAS